MEIQDLTVVLVEPSTTQARIVTGFLRDFGVSTIDIIRQGREAIDEITTTPPDLVISTLYLPDMSGADLVYTIRNDSRLHETAFILISSETRFAYLDPIRQAGATAILPKPFDRDALRIALNSTLDYLEAPELELDEVDTESLHVLIVDDSQMSRNHLKRILNAMGVDHISEANNGRQGAEMIHECYFDLVISDYNMPEMDGQQLVDFIRNSSSQPSLPIIMVTSESDESRLAGIQKSGVSAICDKPFEPITLKRYLEKLLLESNL
jgi:two-component system chemotaxis response regulator CheY